MSSNNNNNDDQAAAPTFSEQWTRALQSFTTPLLTPILALSNHAATHPKTYMTSIIIFSVGIMLLGLSTNFTQEEAVENWNVPRGIKKPKPEPPVEVPVVQTATVVREEPKRTRRMVA